MRISDQRPTTRSGRSSSLIGAYRLKFMEDGKGPKRDFEFEAEDAAMALAIAQKEAKNRWAELWRDGRKLCTIRQTPQGAWEIRADEAGALGGL